MDLPNAFLDARTRSLSLVTDLDDFQWIGPKLSIVNPFHWEFGHIAWFQEFWILRHCRGRGAAMAEFVGIFDSNAAPQDVRTTLAYPPRPLTLSYAARVLEDVLQDLSATPVSGRDAYFHELALYHEDMHTEALLYYRQTLGYPPPTSLTAEASWTVGKRPRGDAEIPGGQFRLGADANKVFVFDNEKWAHDVLVAPFLLSKTPVTEQEFAEFVDKGGYENPDWWSSAGRSWLLRTKVTHPVTWDLGARRQWFCRNFHEKRKIEADLPMIHVNWFEAEAYCRFRGRRLPTEAEWEFAATCDVLEDGSVVKRRYPWGNDEPTPDHAHLGMISSCCAPVTACSHGDSPFGVRQLLGNVWEWTSSSFEAYPGFSADPYQEYSAPFFGSTKVLRGGSFATQGRYLDGEYRNYFPPERRDLFVGFRTAADV